MNVLDLILNILIFGITLAVVVTYFRKDGKWAPERGRFAFRFFTCQSNVLCACAALLAAVFGMAGSLPRWVWVLKYMGTVAVTVTMLTVFLFLWPSIGKGGLKKLMEGSELFVHLINPLMAIVSFCLFERQGMTFAESLWGLVPVAVYGQHYLYRVVHAPEEKRWEDYYGFNKQGKWPVAFGIMMAGAFALCLVFMKVQNL